MAGAAAIKSPLQQAVTDLLLQCGGDDDDAIVDYICAYLVDIDTSLPMDEIVSDGRTFLEGPIDGLASLSDSEANECVATLIILARSLDRSFSPVGNDKENIDISPTVTLTQEEAMLRDIFPMHSMDLLRKTMKQNGNDVYGMANIILESNMLPLNIYNGRFDRVSLSAFFVFMMN